MDPEYYRSLQNHRLTINWVSHSPDGQLVASASDDKSLMVSVLDTNLVYRYTGHTDSVTSVALSNAIMVSGCKDCTARLWRLDKIDGPNYSNESVMYRAHHSAVRCVDINYDESQFCTSSDDKTIKLWASSATNRLVATLANEHTNWVRHARFSRLFPHLFSSCGDDGLICIWDIRKKEAAIKMKAKRGQTHFLSIEWHPTCEYILSSSSSDSNVRVWDLRHEKEIQCYQFHHNIVPSADFHPSGKFLLTASLDQTSKIMDVFTGKCLYTIKTQAGQVNCAQFSPNGKHFATAGQDKMVHYWRTNLDNFDDDEDIRSICMERDPPLHEFETLTKTCCFSTPKLRIKPLDWVDTDSLEAEHTCHTAEETAGFVSFEDGAEVDKKSMDMLRMVHKQLERLTLVVDNLEKRLTRLEDRKR